MAEFGLLNWSIVIVYILSNLLIGYALSKNIKSAEDFYLGQRNIPWWAIGVSVVATYVSALTFLGGPAWSYTEGLSVIAIHLNYPIVIILVITLFLPFFYNSGVASIYEYIEKRFGSKSRSVIALVFLVTQAFGSAAVLYATALVLQFITGIDVTTAIVVITLIALVYTSLGGISAVIWTDVIQAGILLVGSVIIFVALIGELPQPLLDTLSQLKSEGRTDGLKTDIALDQEATVWTGIFAMSLYHVTVYGASQMMVQRTLTAKSIGDAKKSFLMMGFAAFFIYFFFMLMGILFYSFYQGQEFENGNTIILQFASDYGMPGLMGIIAAAVVAASMSSLDSAFNSMSTVSTIDFYQKYFKPKATPEHYLKVTRFFTVFWALMIIIPAIMFAGSTGSILQVLSKVGSYFVGAKLSMFALGFFSRHTTERGLLIGVATSFACLWWVATYTDIAWPWYAVVGGGVNILVSIAASLLLDGKQQELSSYTIKGQLLKYEQGGLEQRQDGWYKVPGKIDPICYWLFGFFALSLILLWLFDAML